jgi:GTPase
MDHPQGVLRTGDRATVEFQFITHPEFIKVGQKLLFREGKTKVGNTALHYSQFLSYVQKGLGVVTKLI